MDVMISGNALDGFAIWMNYQRVEMTANLFRVPGGWLLTGRHISPSGFRIGNRNTNWHNAIAHATAFLRDKIMREWVATELKVAVRQGPRRRQILKQPPMGA